MNSTVSPNLLREPALKASSQCPGSRFTFDYCLCYLGIFSSFNRYWIHPVIVTQIISINGLYNSRIALKMHFTQHGEGLSPKMTMGNQTVNR